MQNSMNYTDLADMKIKAFPYQSRGTTFSAGYTFNY
ncbi:hypothetical protein SAMN05421786_111101 [Chryseobacterium ureilyticum]|uniref:Uncharacterized protein n=1 Tax=Chryseobacterium ureilyticum TaxID=373668 RepID=A0A1N7QK64_9FLAO|nr:hypothetical protein SAMN05421786_111101 [Chryseobacterium ureilyticum]